VVAEETKVTKKEKVSYHAVTFGMVGACENDFGADHY
jgi:hypothetical protein